MRTIVITLPNFIEGEAEKITNLLRRGDVDIVHIRKPYSSIEEVATLIERIPEELASRLVLHDHHILALRYNLYGVHLNGRNPQPPAGWEGSVSRSCHSMKEVQECKSRCDYVSLSPIFDSISKIGYQSAFTEREIMDAHLDGIIDDKVYALGGVTFANLPKVESMGFGGAMILGDAWRNFEII